MTFVTGFLLWLGIGIVGGLIAWFTYRGATTTALVTLLFGVFGSFIGGMLGTSGYIFHQPTPLRFGALLGAVLGALFFSFTYHFIARKAV
jgi:uncharacterized membrane protein YeaQ/YmgE (transglycosylase-associated protein family)